MKYIYFATQDGGLVDNLEIAKTYNILNGESIYYDDLKAIRAFAKTCKGIKGEIKNPSVDYILVNAVNGGHEYSAKILATRIYYRGNDCTLLEAKNFIDKKFDKIKANYKVSNR